MRQDLSVGTNNLTLVFDLVFENFNLANYFWTLNARALMNHLNAPGDKTNNLVHVTLTLGVDLFFENFNLANNISNWDLSDPLCDSINRGLTLVRLLVTEPFHGNQHFDHVTLTMEFGLIFINFLLC